MSAMRYREPKRRLDPVVHELRRRRYETGLGVREFSERMGYSKKSVVQWESGVVMPTLPALRVWCDALGVELTVKEKG